MGLTFRTGYPLDELVMQLAEHGVLRAPQREEGTVEHLEPLPCLEVLVDAVVLGGDGHEGREDDGTDLVIGGGERCVVGGLLVIGEFSTRDRSTEQGADVVELGFLAVRQPEVEAGSDRFADRQARVADGDPSEPLGLQSDQSQAGEATPVLGEEGAGIVDVRVEEELDVRDVLGVGVVPRVGRFVRAAEADQIRSEYPIPGVEQGRDHPTVEVAPGRLAVKQNHWMGILGPLVDVGHPQAVDRPVFWLVREVVEADEAFVRGSDVGDPVRCGVVRHGTTVGTAFRRRPRTVATVRP